MDVITSSTGTREEVLTLEEAARQVFKQCEAFMRASRGLDRLYTRPRLRAFARCAERVEVAMEVYESLA